MTFIASIALTEAQALVLSQAIAEDPALGLHSIDARETAPDRWELAVYFEEAPDKAALAALDALVDSGGGFTVSELPDTDWVAKSLEGLTPIRVGRFLVHGAHDRAARRPNDLAIEIEAGEAFGTGHHGTTAGCLAAIDRVARTGRIANALDIGTGSGVLAIAIARRLHAPVLASDIDPVAVRVAAANIRLNGAGPLVETVCAVGLQGRVFGARGPFDLIVANILAGPLVGLAPSIRRHIAPGGTIVLSGLLPRQANRVAAAYRQQGLRLQRNETRDDWATLTFKRSGI